MTDVMMSIFDIQTTAQDSLQPAEIAFSVASILITILASIRCVYILWYFNRISLTSRALAFLAFLVCCLQLIRCIDMHGNKGILPFALCNLLTDDITLLLSIGAGVSLSQFLSTSAKSFRRLGLLNPQLDRRRVLIRRVLTIQHILVLIIVNLVGGLLIKYNYEWLRSVVFFSFAVNFILVLTCLYFASTTLIETTKRYITLLLHPPSAGVAISSKQLLNSQNPTNLDPSITNDTASYLAYIMNYNQNQDIYSQQQHQPQHLLHIDQQSTTTPSISSSIHHHHHDTQQQPLLLDTTVKISDSGELILNDDSLFFQSSPNTTTTTTTTRTNNNQPSETQLLTLPQHSSIPIEQQQSPQAQSQQQQQQFTRQHASSLSSQHSDQHSRPHTPTNQLLISSSNGTTTIQSRPHTPSTSSTNQLHNTGTTSYNPPSLQYETMSPNEYISISAQYQSKFGTTPITNNQNNQNNSQSNIPNGTATTTTTTSPQMIHRGSHPLQQTSSPMQQHREQQLIIDHDRTVRETSHILSTNPLYSDNDMILNRDTNFNTISGNKLPDKLRNKDYTNQNSLSDHHTSNQHQSTATHHQLMNNNNNNNLNNNITTSPHHTSGFRPRAKMATIDTLYPNQDEIDLAAGLNTDLQAYYQQWRSNIREILFISICTGLLLSIAIIALTFFGITASKSTSEVQPTHNWFKDDFLSWVQLLAVIAMLYISISKAAVKDPLAKNDHLFLEMVLNTIDTNKNGNNNNNLNNSTSHVPRYSTTSSSTSTSYSYQSVL